MKKLFFLLAIFFASQAVFSQSAQNRNFPQGSISGRTEMTGEITPSDFPNITFSASSPKTGKEVAFSVQLLLILTLLTIAPSILILTTCFLRFSIVLDFIKRALSLQQVPPTAVLNGIALFMTLFCMFPVFNRVYENAYKPLSNNELTVTEAFDEGIVPIRIFMYNQIKGNGGENYIMSFMSMAGKKKPATLADVPTYVLIPAYILNELTVAIKVGVLIYIPFVVIDMVVSSILMSMGMMMLPPVQISTPFKLMIFVLVDGWGLLTNNLFSSVMQYLRL
ncbi:MAG: flagellar type III secretion system pore protein FliP [Treponema sp.]|nr:flagellar type III secretion system pore protein FliP [Treponema sp.]